jgi:hypothetical protein
VMPTMVSTNTNAAAVMIGEKGAAMVLGQGPRSLAVAEGRGARVSLVDA